MEIHIDRSSYLPPYKQIKNQIKDRIATNDIKKNELFGSIRKIAKMSGVSIATVQKAFNELKQEKLVYSKSGEGYFLAKQSSITNNVMVFIPNIHLSFYSYIFQGMFEANKNRGLNIHFNSLDTDKLAWNEKTIELLKLAKRDKCSVIFIGEAHGAVREECVRTAKSVPFVTIEWILENAVSIVNDYKKAGFQMMEYLATKRNASNIMVLTGRTHQYNAQERLLGMQEAALKYNFKEGHNLFFVKTDFDAISAYEAIKKHYPNSQKSDAVICANDYEAMGAIGAFLEKKVLVGKDVALIGFGNMIDSTTSYIPLTTMDQRLKLIGTKAIQAIDNLLKGSVAVGTIISVPTKLLEKQT